MMTKKTKTIDLIMCTAFAALIAVGAYIRFYVGVVPFTMQVFFVILAGMLLGSKIGTVSVLIYIFIGLLGIPVFTDGGGIWYFLNPKFGYIIGFAIAAFVIGIMIPKGECKFLRYFIAGLTGIGIIYLVGVSYYWAVSFFYLRKNLSFQFLMIYCFLITLPGDILSCLLAAVISKRISKAVKR
mgnify:FL=1